MPSILFVCTGNICRSPLAAALWRARVAGEPGWRVESAGTWALDGHPASANTLAVLAERGLDAPGHRARTVNGELLSAFNLILVMERGHAEALRAEFPDVAGRVYLLSEMIGREFDIADPYGGPVVEYEATAQEIERIFELGADRMRELARDKSLSEN